MVLQQTLVLVKPDGVARGLTGEVIKRFEQRGLKLVALKLVRVNMDHAKQHYTEDITERRGEKVRNQLLDFITGGPVVAMIIEGVDAIENVRKLIGATESKAAVPGTIRGDFTHVSYSHADEKDIPVRNVIHASADEADAKHEAALWFSVDELFDYRRADESHVF
jgi:nucleoside-diphosphate kinase